jgi:hypothetical protein
MAYSTVTRVAAVPARLFSISARATVFGASSVAAPALATPARIFSRAIDCSSRLFSTKPRDTSSAMSAAPPSSLPTDSPTVASPDSATAGRFSGASENSQRPRLSQP